MFLIFAQPSESSVEVNVQELISQQLDGSNVLTEKNNTVTTCHDQQKKTACLVFRSGCGRVSGPGRKAKLFVRFKKNTEMRIEKETICCKIAR